MGRKKGRHSVTGSTRPASDGGQVATVEDLIQQGLEAIDAYDYELARTSLTSAFERSDGAEGAARALLTLLVDHLGADHEALAISDRLSRQALASPEVQFALGLAAARSGVPQRARAHLDHLAGTGAAEILVILADAALAAGDLEEAARLCDEALSHDQVNPGAHQVARRLAKAREDMRRPLEAAIAQVAAEGRLEEARRLAQELLTRFPESPVARRTVQAALDQLQAREAERLVQAAEEALEQSDFDAMQALRFSAHIAVAGAPPNEELSLRLAAIESRYATLELDARVNDAVKRLADPDLRPGLACYVSLPTDARARVREVAARPVLNDLEHLLARRADPNDAVTAILALVEATSIAGLDPQGALKKLAAHERALMGLSAASQLATRLRQRIREERQRQHSNLLAAARTRLDENDPAAALEVLARVALREMDPEERESAEALRKDAKVALETIEMEASYERLLQADPLAARDVAERLLARAGAAERERRQAQIAAAREAIRRAFGVWTFQVGDDLVAELGGPHTIDLSAPLNIATSGREPIPCLDSAGRTLILLECCGHWNFVQRVDLEVGRVLACAVIRTPEALDRPTTAISPAGTLTIAAFRGVLELSLQTWEPLSWGSRSTLGFDLILESMVVAPEGRFVWTHSTRDVAIAERTRVVDLERRRVVRDMADGSRFWPLAGASEPTMAYLKRGTVLSLHHPSGVPVEGGRIELPASVTHALVHPSGGRWLVFVEEARKNRKRLGLVEIDATGHSSAPRWIDHLSPGQAWVFATSLTQQASFVVTHEENDSLSLHALRSECPGLPVEPLYQAPLPVGTRLARDPSSRHVVALVPDHERLHVVPLGPTPPTFPSCTPELELVQVPGFAVACGFSVPLEDAVWASARELRSYPERLATAWMRRQIAASGRNIVELLKIHHILDYGGQTVVCEDFLCWLEEKLPSDPHVAALRAAKHAMAKRWAEVRSMLDGVDLQALLPEYRQHAHHIFGLSLLAGGELDRSIDVIESHQDATNGHCHLDELLAVLRPLRDDKAPSSPLVRLRTAICEADAYLLRNDLSGARAAIDRPIVWQGGEVQSLARLAEVELREEPERAARRFRKALALARFISAHRATVLRKDLPLPGTSWLEPRITELEVRAGAWLGRLGAPEVTSEGIGPTSPETSPSAPETAWELALCELDAVLDTMAADASSLSPARLAFRVHHAGRKFAGIDVLLQRQLQSRRFSAGQQADAGELISAADVLTEDVDAAAVVVLTDGVPQAPRSRPSPSRARMVRLLATLVEHPRVFLTDRPTEPVGVQLGRLGLELVSTADGLVPCFILGGARWTADEVLAHRESSVVIDVDPEALVVTLAPVSAAMLALVQALQRHHPVFPEESHRELRRRLGALQHEVDLHLPPAIAGTTHVADSRPVLRLTQEGETVLLAEIGVRPVPGAVFVPPGEGSRLALGAVDGLPISARRDLARERTTAERLRALPALTDATREGRWRYRLQGEEQCLALVEALTELGTEVVVEWPKDARTWRWVGKASPKDLRVRVVRRHDLLGIDGEAEIDGHRVALAALLEAIAQGRRYVAIGPQLFISLAAELRERLAAAGDLIHASHGGLEAGLAAAPLLADLEEEQRINDAPWRLLREQTIAARSLDPELPTELRADLRPYQLEGFRWLARLSAWTAGACLADDMGLGKTVQTLALLVHRAALGPALVIAPISVTPGWISEAARFAPGLRVVPYRGANRDALLANTRPGDIIIAGYGVVTRDPDALAKICFSTLILDEAHFIKNSATRRARAVGRLRADFSVALTGTPVENHLGELWSLFRVISPGLLGTWPQFRERFAAPIEREQSAERQAALGQVLRPFMLRRTKESVLPDLPPRIELHRLVSLSAAERELYETARLAAVSAIADDQAPNHRFAVLGWLTRLRRLACHPRLFHDAWTGASSKLDAFMAVVDELRATGHRALVFSQFTDHLALVRDALTAKEISTIYLDGSTPLDDRARAVESFQGGVGDLFLISLKAGGTGLNLTAADHVIHLDPWWNPAVEDQATDRAHRIGQSRPVTVIRLIAQGTIEETVLAMHADKRDLAERLLEGTDVAGRLSVEELSELVRGRTPSPLESFEEDERDLAVDPSTDASR